MESAFVGSAIALAWISFAAFLVLAWMQLQAAKKAAEDVQASATQTSKTFAETQSSKSLVDFDPAKLFESAAKLVDSLTKAGPSLASLGAAVLFLAIAAYGIQKPASQGADCGKT